jgi:putative hydrolase of the HAD superfamily
MKRYQAILFDLFDTLVDLNGDRFPLIKVGDEERHSTGGVVYEALRESYSHIRFEQFYQAFISVSQEMERRRREVERELPSQDRFRLLLRRLGIESPPEPVVERLVSVHMDEMFKVMELPPERRRMLEELKPHYRLGIVSNFDHPPTVYRLLRHYNLDQFFNTIVISAEIGWRKPRKEIFWRALTSLQIPPEETLFVGDTPGDDIIGAKGVGMDVVWLNRRGQPLPVDIPQPEYEISRLEDLPGLLRGDT